MAIILFIIFTFLVVPYVFLLGIGLINKFFEMFEPKKKAQ